MRGVGRRRSTSEGEGDKLSSTLDLPEGVRLTDWRMLISIDMRRLLRLMLRGLLMITLRVVGGRGWNQGSVLDQGLFQMLLM